MCVIIKQIPLYCIVFLFLCVARCDARVPSCTTGHYRVTPFQGATIVHRMDPVRCCVALDDPTADVAPVIECSGFRDIGCVCISGASVLNASYVGDGAFNVSVLVDRPPSATIGYVLPHCALAVVPEANSCASATVADRVHSLLRSEVPDSSQDVTVTTAWRPTQTVRLCVAHCARGPYIETNVVISPPPSVPVPVSKPGSNGTVSSYTKMTKAAGGLDASFPLAASDYFGTSVAMGDVDGDGVLDAMVGAYGDDTGGVGNGGAVYVLFLTRSGRVANATAYVKITKGAGGLDASFPLAANDLFGTSVAMGDVDGDAVLDAMVGARNDDTGVSGGGAVYVLFLTRSGRVANATAYVKITKGAGGLDASFPLAASDNFGSSVAMGDVDGDGVLDAVVGAYLDDTGASSNGGAVYVLFLTRSGRVANATAYVKITKGAGGLDASFPLAAGDNFGTSVAMGDVDGDGVLDAMVGAYGDDTGGVGNGGAVYVLFLTRSGRVANATAYVKITKGAGGLDASFPLAAGDNFGSSVAMGDVDGDGVLDAMVGAYGDDTGGVGYGGAVYVLVL